MCAKTNVAYPGIVRTAFSPSDIVTTPSSQPAHVLWVVRFACQIFPMAAIPLITLPTPIAVLKSPLPTELSNLSNMISGRSYSVKGRNGLFAAVVRLLSVIQPTYDGSVNSIICRVEVRLASVFHSHLVAFFGILRTIALSNDFLLQILHRHCEQEKSNAFCSVRRWKECPNRMSPRGYQNIYPETRTIRVGGAETGFEGGDKKLPWQ